MNKSLKLRLFSELVSISWAGVDLVLKATCGLMSSHNVDWALSLTLFTSMYENLLHFKYARAYCAAYHKSELLENREGKI